MISSRDDSGLTNANIEDESKKRREVLARRPSYRKILNELSSADVSALTSSIQQNEIKSEVDCDPHEATTINVGGQYLKVLPASALQLAGSQDGSLHGLQTLAMTNTSGTGATGAIVQYATQGQGGQFFVPGRCYFYYGQDNCYSSIAARYQSLLMLTASSLHLQ